MGDSNVLFAFPKRILGIDRDFPSEIQANVALESARISVT
jgi:hypothetical protein